jgi:hypothetical protein
MRSFKNSTEVIRKKLTNGFESHENCPGDTGSKHGLIQGAQKSTFFG